MLGVIKQVRYDYMLTRFSKADRTVMRMKRHGMLRVPVDVAIDKHAIPRYDKTYNMLNIITSKFKSGTYHFELSCHHQLHRGKLQGLSGGDAGQKDGFSFRHGLKTH